MKLLLPLLLVLPMIGCNAGTTYQLLGYDAIDAAAVESAKGVKAYDTAIRLAIVKDREAYIAKLGRDVVKIALSKGETPESAAKLATAIVDATSAHIAGNAEQERRRAQWFGVTVDNLEYIRDVCADAKAFAIYRSSIDAQWKHYLQTQTRARLARIGADNGQGTTPATTRPK